MNIYILFADIGRAVVITGISFFLAALGIYLHAVYYNKARLKACKPLNPKEEIKAVLHPYLGSFIAAFSFLIAAEMTDSLVGRIIIGLCYLVAVVILFRSDRH